MYKAPLTASVFSQFASNYQSFTSKSPESSAAANPYVYVDGNGFKLVADIVEDESSQTDGIFALSVAQDGWMEMLALYERN